MPIEMNAAADDYISNNAAPEPAEPTAPADPTPDPAETAPAPETPEGEETSAPEVPADAVAQERARLEARRRAETEAREREAFEAMKARMGKFERSQVLKRMGELLDAGVDETAMLRTINEEFLAKKLTPETAEQKRLREIEEGKAELEQRRQQQEQAEFDQARGVLVSEGTRIVTEKAYPLLHGLSGGGQRAAELAADEILQHYRNHGSLEGVDLEGILKREEQTLLATLKQAIEKPSIRAALGLTAATAAAPTTSPKQTTAPAPIQADDDEGLNATVILTARDAAARNSVDGDDFDFTDSESAKMSIDAKLRKKYGL